MIAILSIRWAFRAASLLVHQIIYVVSKISRAFYFGINHSKIGLLSALLLINCASANSAKKDDEQPEYKRGKLSEAMKKASDDNKGSKKVADSKMQKRSEASSCLFPDFSSISSEQANNDEDRVQYPSKSHYYNHQQDSKIDSSVNYLGMTFSGGSYLSEELRGVLGFSVLYSNQVERRRNGIGFCIGRIPVGKNSPLFKSIGDIAEYLVTYHHCFYFRRNDCVINPFLQLALSGKMRYWKYNNKIYTDVYDANDTFIETQCIKSDELWGAVPEVDFGTRFYNGETIDISAFFGVGRSIYSGTTSHSFKNDVFESDVVLRLVLVFLYGSSQ
jgi:hypothetical protein